MTHYFIDFGYSTATKNKPQHEIEAYLRTLHRKLIMADDLENAKLLILDEIKEIFSRHPRCKPLEMYFDIRGHKAGGQETGAVWLSGFPAVVFKFEPATLVNTEYLGNNEKQ